jgi:hypothetical protein
MIKLFNRMQLTLLVLILAWGIGAGGMTYAQMDWETIKQFELTKEPLDIAVSEAGKMVFILFPGEIAVYSMVKDKMISVIPLEASFSRIVYSQENDALILSSAAAKTLKILRVDQVYPIDIAGLPFKGPENAPVTITVFDDYQ